jgi:hypothetical protein
MTQKNLRPTLVRLDVACAGAACHGAGAALTDRTAKIGGLTAEGLTLEPERCSLRIAEGCCQSAETDSARAARHPCGWLHDEIAEGWISGLFSTTYRLTL